MQVRQNPLWLWNPEETPWEIQNRGTNAIHMAIQSLGPHPTPPTMCAVIKKTKNMIVEIKLFTHMAKYWKLRIANIYNSILLFCYCTQVLWFHGESRDALTSSLSQPSTRVAVVKETKRIRRKQSLKSDKYLCVFIKKKSMRTKHRPDIKQEVQELNADLLKLLLILFRMMLLKHAWKLLILSFANTRNYYCLQYDNMVFPSMSRSFKIEHVHINERTLMDE